MQTTCKRFRYLFGRLQIVSRTRALLSKIWLPIRLRVIGPIYRQVVLWLTLSYRVGLRRVIFIGVTGSCGKTTTKELIAAILSGQFKGHKNWGNGNVPDQIARTVFGTRPWHKFCVQEIAAAAAQGIPLEIPLRLVKPQIGVVTNIGTDHISAFGTMEAIAAEKGKLIAALPQNGTAILNADDANVLAMQARCTCRVITYGLTPEAMVRAENVRCSWPERLSFTVRYGDQSQFVQTQLCATHLVSCVLGALAVGVAMGIPLAIGARAVQRVQPYLGRMCPETVPGGVTFIRDDIKAPLWTIPSALKFMEEAEAKRKIVVMGTISDIPERNHGKAYKKYAEVARQALDVVDYIFFVGPWASKALQAKQNPANDRLQAFSNVQAITNFLNDFLQPEDLVLIKGSDKTDHLVEIVLKLKKLGIEKNLADKPQFSESQNLQQISLGSGSTGHKVDPCNSDDSLGSSQRMLPAEGLNRVHVIVGLGNPEKKYQNTPHNVGQKVLDKLLHLMGGEWTQEHDWMLARVEWRGNTIYLVKPMLAINNTGPLLSELGQRLRLPISQFIIVQDDLSLPLGAVRLRMKGSAGGHKGMASIIDAFQTEMIRRTKIGVGQPPQNMTANEYVLKPFFPPAQSVIESACAEASNRICDLVGST